MKLSFHKMVASGNDFIVIDNRRLVIKNPKSFARQFCPSHIGIGADGILLMEKSRKADFKMRIINSDGSEAEACGNGFRCIALFAHRLLNYPKTFRFESLSGIVEARIQGRQVAVQLPVPKDLRLRAEIEVLGNRLHYSFINTGVPHAVVFVEGLDKIEVHTLGRAIRQHRQFQPKGTNVNFVEVSGRNKIQVRTYERGVEAETKACGTGSTASAIISTLMGFVHAPVKVKTAGGEVLTINFKRENQKIRNVTLQGMANFVYEGQLSMSGDKKKG